MKLLIEPLTKKKLHEKLIDGLILPLKGFSVQSNQYFTKEEIKKISEQNPKLEIFVSINKTFFNNELEQLKKELKYLDKLKLQGIIFYDLAILQLKKELNLSIDLVWNQTYMVNNYKTCNYYHSKGVKYAILSKEITLEEIKEIIKNTNMTCMVEVVCRPSIAFSNRKLLTNYFKDCNKTSKRKIEITEKVSDTSYNVKENKCGTNFILNKTINGTSIIKDLYEIKTPYIIMKEYGIDKIVFPTLLKDTKKYLETSCVNKHYIEKYNVLGNYTGFFFKKTIYKVKKGDK